MEQDLGEDWVVVARDGCERSRGKADDKVEDLRGEKGVKSWEGDARGEEEENKSWEELVAQEEMAAGEADVREGHRWRKYV